MFIEDLLQFFETEEFAVIATFTRASAPVTTVNVIFNDPSQSVPLYDTDVEELAPFLMAPASSVAAVKRKDDVSVNGAGYKVERLHPDGTGLMRIEMKRA